VNYLAHLSLSQMDPGLMTGNFIADDIPRKEEPLLPEDIAKGIVLHRQIDDYTDGHPAFKKTVQRLRPHHRKYAPVVVDILNDHLLSRHWGQFHSVSESDFQSSVYDVLTDQVVRLPPKVSLHVQTLLEYQYLKAYGTRDGMRNVLSRMDKRTRFPSDFASAVDHLYEDLDFYSEQFILLYSDLVSLVDCFE